MEERSHSIQSLRVFCSVNSMNKVSVRIHNLTMVIPYKSAMISLLEMHSAIVAFGGELRNLHTFETLYSA